MPFWPMHWWKNSKQRAANSKPLAVNSRQINWFTAGCWLLTAHCSLAQSVLREGIWLKIGVTQSGVYRLDQATLARINPAFARADPRRLRLYGNGGAPLPQANAATRATDLTENAVLVTGEADGRLDAGDALLFFGQSPHTIHYDSTGRRFVHQINPYADTTFYFLTIGSVPGLRMKERPAGNAGASAVVTTFDDYQFYEPDVVKVPAVRSGREWLGDYLTTDTTKTVSFEMPGLVANAPVRLRASVVAGATGPTQFRLRMNDQLAGTLSVPAISGYEYDYQGFVRADTFLVRPTKTDNGVRLGLTFQHNGQYSAQGYLDYLAVQARRELLQFDQPVWVRRLSAGSVRVRQATSTLRVWDVTNPLIPVVQAYALSTGREASWIATQARNYFLFTDARQLAPALITPVANQNLHAQPTPNLLIITPNAWRDEAERLAKFRRDNDRLSVLVVTTQQVYNEFGSGQPDPTAIRDAARYFYQQQPGQLRYLLLFGDATFDYRNIKGTVSPTQLANMVPVYQSRESLHPVLSYSSDDYFGFMDADEGEWIEVDRGDHKLDIGVGRLPVKSAQEAQTLVDKLIRYASDRSLLGDWQTRVMLVADDGDYNIHQRDADQLADIIEADAPAFRPERIFLDDFQQTATPTGQKAPAVNQLINQGMNDGRLIINYSGHGGILGLADEQVVTLQDILSWRNRRLPLLITATCQFGRYDDPDINSGAELTLLNRSGGAVGLLTTTRPVYANTNLLLNEAFYGSVFKPVNGQMPRLGDVMRLTKNNSLSGPVNRNFALLGDPSMRLAYPQAQVTLTAVNGQALTATRQPTLRALETVELTGEIQQNGQRLADFNGTAKLTLFDKVATVTTLGQKAESPKMTYQAYTNSLYSGQVTVRQGRFTMRFTMPKDIDYTVGRAKLYAYAVRTDSLLDAVGGSDSLFVGGSVIAENVDAQPPSLTLSVADGQRQGESWQVTGPNVTVRIDLRDDYGINIARSGLGHELTAQLDGQSPVVLNDEYVAVGSNGQQGQVVHTFRDMLPGTYALRVKAWDINNNSTEGALTLVVSERPGLRLWAIRVSPNPVATEATISVEHDRAGESLDWTLDVYNLNGLLLGRRSGQCTDCAGTINTGTWNGRSETGESQPSGTYIVRVQLRAATDGTTATGSARAVLTK